MEITLIHYSAPPIVGGVESVMAHHAKLMASAGHKVTIIAGAGQVIDRRIQFHSIPQVSSRHTNVLDAKAELDKGVVPAGFSRLVKEIKTKLLPLIKNSDWLIAHNVCSLHKNLALTAAIHELCLRPGSPKILQWHHDLAWTSANYQAELYSGYPWDLLRTAWPGVTQVTISEQRRLELAELQNIVANTIRVIPNGLDIPELFKLGTVARDLVRTLNLFSSAPIFLLPVRITRRKNIEMALRIMSAIIKKLPNAKLVITGPLGAHNPVNLKYFDDLKEVRSDLNLANAVHFLAETVQNLLPDEVIFDLYRVADALLFPSLEEGFGIPVLEAGLARLPIFCSEIPALKSLGGSEAHYFDPNADPELVANLIVETLASDKAYQLRVRVRQYFSWPAIYSNQIAPLLGDASAG